VRYEAQHRSIYLKCGAARFEVAPDASRPFVVITREGQARAVGTDFTMTYAPLGSHSYGHGR
jgi:transmembrane sensor